MCCAEYFWWVMDVLLVVSGKEGQREHFIPS